MTVLRDMRREDVEDYVRWFTRCTDWMRTDAPWKKDETSPEAERRSWTEYWESVRELPEDAVRWKFEIEWNGKHVGWVCRYSDLEYLDNPQAVPAVGIDIPEPSCRGRGVGTEALRLFIEYLRERGFPCVYTQTWSGNAAMLRVAEKLGFRPFRRMPGYRIVDGKAYDAVTLKLGPDGP